MEIASKYSPEAVENKWYQYWMDKGFFHSEPDGREPYTVVIPPPNVTGVLHMGHMLNNTIQDILVRRARMKGFNACWVPGTDHASIATEAKVVGKLASKGIKKTDLTRDEFLAHAWDWTHEHGGIILEQLKRLGASCDWQRTAFTMDDERSQSVLDVFVDLYNKGLIYRGIRVVNWDPQALTALSDEEVVYKESQGKLYYLRYFVEGMPDKYIVVATTRPETIMGDTAVCINPNDERYNWLNGKRVIVPIVNRAVPIIEDEYVEIEFGTGCLKVTPAHDVNDYMLGEKYQLESIDIFNDNGTLNEKGGAYAGMDRFDVRDKIEKDLQAAGLMEKTEPYTNKVGHSERTDAAIEPKLSMQWFLKMEHLAKPALAAVMNDDIKLHPAKFKNTYRHWMENVKDWCVSRQLWWGHRIPAYYLPDGAYVVATTPQDALAIAKQKTGNEALTLEDLTQESDCLDTWFSSWLWPISVFAPVMDKDNADLKYYYPTSDLVTGPDILFFWVARMIMAGYEYMGDMPFKNVYLTGIVRDAQGRKMSKSLGNSPDPLLLIDKYGADGVRMGMMMAAPAGNDVLFEESLCEQGRNFCNKIWNAFRLIKGWEVTDSPQPEASALAVKWLGMKIDQAKTELDDLFSKYRISEALTTVYKLFWDDFSSWYLEIIKPSYGSPIDNTTLEQTMTFFEELLTLLHPFMPFITEELWQAIRKRNDGESIMVTLLESPTEIDETFLQSFAHMQEVISGIRSIRLGKNIPQKEALTLEAGQSFSTAFDAVIIKMGNLDAITRASEKSEGAASFMVGTDEFAVPLGGLINVEEEKAKLEADLAYQEKFLSSVMKKLANESFVSKAPEQVIAIERKKQSDAESRIATIKQSLEQLKSQA
ncbi:valine--tRNA ligase [Porphyromonas pogonae]|uniref:valine--tRNA ligase n=1 Tax=Porphyromonas pogonae TaxID=867595 RepID=UPI002E797EA0|nr:valine--tRNA ligase [Porphyromonas pogonae]